MSDRRVLGWVRGQDLRPGQNLPGGGADAGWVYALPSLELRSVGHLGALSERLEGTLRRFSPRVLRLDDDDGRRSTASAAELDLIVIDRAWATNGAAITHAASRLAPDGVMYVEASAERAGSGELHSVEWWVTPLRGEPVTVVPAGHHAAAEHFRRRRLGAPMLTRERIGHVRRRVTARRASQGAAPAARPSGAGSMSEERRGAHQLLRTVGHRLVYGGAAAMEEVERSLLDRMPGLRRRVQIVVPRGTPPGAMPHYIRAAAGGAEDLIGWQWSMTARAEYLTQKIIFFLFPPRSSEPQLVAKVARSDDVSPRLRNAHHGLIKLDALRTQLGDRVPAPAALSEHRGLAVLVEGAIAGSSLDRAGITERRIQHGVSLLIDLALATAQPMEPGAVAVALDDLRVRCEAAGIIDAEEGQALRAAIADLSGIHEPLTCVLQHGDPGCWNMVVRPSGDLVLLDWENVETPGLPLWDMLDFLRSCAVVRAGATGRAQVSRASLAPFIGEGELAGTLADAVRRYRAALPMDDRYFVALFYSAWAYQALKESTRQRAGAVGDGVYGRLLRALLQRYSAGGRPRADEAALNG